MAAWEDFEFFRAERAEGVPGRDRVRPERDALRSEIERLHREMTRLHQVARRSTWARRLRRLVGSIPFPHRARETA